MRHVLRSLVQFLLVLFALYAYRQFQGGFVSNFLFFSFLGVAVFEGWSFVTLLAGFRGERTFSPSRLVSGETLEVALKITSRMPFPLCWLRVEEALPPKLNREEESPSFFHLCLFRRHIQSAYKMHALPRGEHAFTSMSWEGGSLFGLITMRGSLLSDDTVRVLPRLLDIGRLQQQGLISKLSAVRVSDDLEWSDVRLYQPGDKLSRIHWKASAKAGKWMTMRSLSDDEKNLFLVLDTGYLAYTDDAQFEKAVSLTATLERWARRQGFSVGLITVQGRALITIPPKNDLYWKQALERVLVRIERTTTPWRELFADDSRDWKEALWVVISGKDESLHKLRARMGKIVPYSSSKTRIMIVESMRVHRPGARYATRAGGEIR
ncbi:MAG: hypothetical protein BSOLF_0776 [Candidatus Carbobacillus altaicus]|uniref:DUF58 domain-containing protein n=1 Tax=Candidatus Carbonibacillus altaicus TaxID=2163959 RepID=A0A2R6XXB2_9BACL|nr:MAG: hypothetical protein BSOLF_0776 [Candidatus Carbobacillus altaicus]